MVFPVIAIITAVFTLCKGVVDTYFGRDNYNLLKQHHEDAKKFYTVQGAHNKKANEQQLQFYDHQVAHNKVAELYYEHQIVHNNDSAVNQAKLLAEVRKIRSAAEENAAATSVAAQGIMLLCWQGMVVLAIIGWVVVLTGLRHAWFPIRADQLLDRLVTSYLREALAMTVLYLLQTGYEFTRQPFFRIATIVFGILALGAMTFTSENMRISRFLVGTVARFSMNLCTAVVGFISSSIAGCFWVLCSVATSTGSQILWLVSTFIHLISEVSIVCFRLMTVSFMSFGSLILRILLTITSFVSKVALCTFGCAQVLALSTGAYVLWFFNIVTRLLIKMLLFGFGYLSSLCTQFEVYVYKFMMWQPQHKIPVYLLFIAVFLRVFLKAARS